MLAISAGLSVAAPSASAQTDSAQCVWRGVRQIKSSHAYRNRGTWCEGLYARPVGEIATLALVSLIQVSRGLETSKAKELVLSWQSDSTDSVSVVAESLDPRTPYRMSFVRTGVPLPFRWSLEIARAERLTADRFGILASTWRRIGGVRQQVYLPLRLAAVPPVTVRDTFAAMVVPSADLKSLRLRVGTLQRGDIVIWRHPERSLGRSFYLRDQPIRVTIPAAEGDSIWVIRLVGIRDGGGSSSREFFVRLRP